MRSYLAYVTARITYAMDTQILNKCAECLSKKRYYNLVANNNELDREIERIDKFKEELAEVYAKIAHTYKLI